MEATAVGGERGNWTTYFLVGLTSIPFKTVLEEEELLLLRDSEIFGKCMVTL